MAFGPVAGGFLLEHFWWGSVFLVNIPIVAIGALVFTVIESPHWGWGSLASISGFVLAAIALVVFVRYESRRNDPLRDVTSFRNARLSAATGSIGIAFLCLFGFTFLVTQCFQFVRGYDPLESGLRTLPFAVGAGITAPLAARAALRWGTTRVVALGLFNMSMGFLIVSRISADAGYWWPIVPSMLLIASGLSLVTSPSTEAVMGSVPRERAGVASAVDDISRELGGTLGVAITGSIFISLYSPDLVERFTAIPGLLDALPAGVFDLAQDSVGAAFVVAQNSPSIVQPQVFDAVSESFITGFGTACLVVSVVAFVGSLFALKYLPARSTSPIRHRAVTATPQAR